LVVDLSEINTWFHHDNNGLTPTLNGVNYTNGTVCPIISIELLMIDELGSYINSNSSELMLFNITEAVNYTESLDGMYENPMQLNLNVTESFAIITNWIKLTTHGGVTAMK
jgi:hypothetical protein